MPKIGRPTSKGLTPATAQALVDSLTEQVSLTNVNAILPTPFRAEAADPRCETAGKTIFSTHLNIKQSSEFSSGGERANAGSRSLINMST